MDKQDIYEQDMENFGRLCSEANWQRLMDENDWHHDVCQTGEWALHILPALDW